MYLLLLPGLVCAETNTCKDELQNSALQTADHGEHEDEDCGNFCTCSCCVHIVSANFQSPQIIIDKPFTKRQLLSIYNNISLPSNYFGNIWQPPRVG
jgi:hypothetical protein